MTTWKPYIFEGREYLEARKIQSWEDIAAQYPGVAIPRSELNKPYTKENYQVDEWSWPGWDPPELYWPDPPTWDPPGGGNPCEIDDECTYLDIFGPSVAECGKRYWFTNLLVIKGCTLPPGFVLGWTASAGEILSIAVGMKWRAPDCCHGDKVTICANGPGCEACIEVTLDCEVCCAEFTLSGAATVNPSSTWVGTIDPPCPGATCEVTSNSGCTLECTVDETGTQVLVTLGGSDCGSFTVTVTEAGKISDGCAEYSDSATVRINDTGQGGSWQAYGAGNGSCCAGGACTCNPVGGVIIGCIVGQYRYLGVANPGTSCMCVNAPWCCTSPLTTRPCDVSCANPCGQSCATTCPSVSCGIPPGTFTGECKITWTAQEWKCSC